MNIKFSNYSLWIGKKHDHNWFEWCVFVDEDFETLKNIKYVEYILHPTFPDPIRRTIDRSQKFALYSSGWGEFIIRIKVGFEDGKVINDKYSLSLDTDNWLKKDMPSDFENTDATLVYKSLKHEKYRWRKLATIIKATNFSEDKIKAILKDLENDHLVRKSPFKSIDNREMWGVTSIVGCFPHM